MTSGLSFTSIFNNAKVAGMIIMDKDGVILQINSAFTHAYGYLEDQIVGKNFALLFKEEDLLKKLPEIELETVKKEGSSMDENYIVHQNGTLIWTYGESIMTVNEKKEVRIVKIIYDINKQKELEKLLISTNVELEEAKSLQKNLNIGLEEQNLGLTRTNKDLDTFVYAASHDLKAPINNLEGLTATLKSYLELGEDPSEIIKMIEGAINKFKSLLTDLSHTGKIKNQEKKQEEFVQFKEIWENAKYNLSEEIINTNAIITEDFINAPGINISRKNLHSILHNLLSNALKYRHTARRPNISIDTITEADGTVVLTFTDNVIGIKEENQSRVFSKYERYHVADDVQGTGVGLFIVARIIENEGGTIEVKSVFGVGTTFIIHFPIQ